MRIATTIAQKESGEWVTLRTDSDIDGQINLLKKMTDDKGLVIGKKDKVEQYRYAYILTTSRPIATRKF